MTTELEKFTKVVKSGDNQTIGDFVDWLGENGYWVSEYVKFDHYDAPQLVPIRKTNEALLAEFFGINLAQLDRERRDLLEQITQPQSSDDAAPRLKIDHPYQGLPDGRYCSYDSGDFEYVDFCNLPRSEHEASS
jgi:hypothetical protein